MTERHTSSGSLLRRIERLLATCSFLPPDAALVVGVSGGPDSVCLLHLLTRLAPRFQLRLWAAHLDHGLRGREGEADAAFVARLCQDLGVPCIGERHSVPEYQRAHPRVTSLEAAAREVRYAFFTQVAYRVGAETVAVGHTADDQVETVLLHLLRGSGLAGLGGMGVEGWWHDRPSGRSLRVLRPLLEVRRATTVAYCGAHHLATRRDPSNLARHFRRNRIRLELLPQLRSINPNVEEALLRLAHQAREEETFWQEEVQRAWPHVAALGRGEVALSRQELSALPVPLVKRLIKHAYAQLTQDPQGLQSAHVEAVLRLLHRGAGKTLDLSNGVAVRAGYRALVLQRGAAAPPQTPPPPVPLPAPGETTWGGWKARTQLFPHPAWPAEPNPWLAYLDYHRTGSALWLRGRQPGDRFQPLGMAGQKKLQDLLVDTRVPRELRHAVPLLEAQGHIVWVGGLRIGEAHKVTAATRTTLVVELTPVTREAFALLQSCDGLHYNTPARAPTAP